MLVPSALESGKNNFRNFRYAGGIDFCHAMLQLLAALGPVGIRINDWMGRRQEIPARRTTRLVSWVRSLERDRVNGW
ncbi:hypothetical protein RRG08_030730 [Elysia crispata]|uniref:Uncharacterized protein n=1 Tax=Elysia crispata TaxID=231223 RepID=A0AAE0Y4Q7_9GAST|nr:hypothetical protein RRG08_030730 [Elysia crispata]